MSRVFERIKEITIRSSLLRSCFGPFFSVFAASCFFVVIYNTDYLIGDFLGGPIYGPIESISHDSLAAFASTLIKFIDLSTTLNIALFVVFGYVFRVGFGRAGWVQAVLIAVSSLFLMSSTLSLFFIFRLQSSFLSQIQFERINYILLQKNINIILFLLFISAICCLGCIVLHTSKNGGSE